MATTSTSSGEMDFHGKIKYFCSFFFCLFVAFVDWLVIKNGAHETSSNNDVKVDRMHSHNNYTVINIFVYNCFSFMKRGMWL